MTVHSDFELLGELEDLRLAILKAQQGLVNYGFDPRRGVETYSLSDLRNMLMHAPAEVRASLLVLIETQEKLYLELYGIAGLKKLSVDTDTPEKRLATVKNWLLGGEKNNPEKKNVSKFRETVKGLASILARYDDAECEKEITSLLDAMYKREYDKVRVIRWVLDRCVGTGMAGDPVAEASSPSLHELLRSLLECREKMGKQWIAALLARSGRRAICRTPWRISSAAPVA